MKYAFIAQYQTTWPVTRLCDVWDVSRSGFYTYGQRPAVSGMDSAELPLLTRVRAIHAKTGQSDGSRRMAKPLQDDGFAVGRYKARRLMRQAGVAVGRTKRRPLATDSRHAYPIAPDLLARGFDVAKPDHVWAGDITYVWRAEGWVYLAVRLDLSSRKIVGWAMSSRMDADLVQEALRMALGRRCPSAGLIHHADRGSQYACRGYQRLLAAHGIRCSMSRKGKCLDNAVVERFFGSLKRARIVHRHYATRQEARADVVEYIEMFYNSTRKHSYLGYVSPNEWEAFTQVA